MALQRDQMRQYLLGSATAAETEEIEVRVIEDEDISNDLYVAESELIEDYLEGSLTDTEREMFEKYFLVSDERRERVSEIRLLKRFSSGPHRFDIPDGEADAKPSWFRMQWLVPAFGVLVLALAGLAVWQFVISDGLSPLERQYAELNRKNFADPGELGGIESVTISPGIYRSTGTGNVVAVTGQGESILFRLPLSFEVEPNTVFQSDLISADGGRFAIGDARVFREGLVSEVRFLAPRSAIRKGFNRIELKRQGSNDAPVVYSFEGR